MEAPEFVFRNWGGDGGSWFAELGALLLIQFLESLLKPEEREAREYLFAAAKKYDISPYGKPNSELRDIVGRREFPL